MFRRIFHISSTTPATSFPTDETRLSPKLKTKIKDKVGDKDLAANLIAFFEKNKGLEDLDEDLGEGNYGKVFLVDHPDLGMVAMKLFNYDRIERNKSTSFLLTKDRKGGEGVALALRGHDNLVETKGIVTYDRSSKKIKMYQKIEEIEDSHNEMIICVFSKYVENSQEFYEYLEGRDALSIPELKDFGYQILEAVSYIHSKGMIHRDIKPENLLINDKLKLFLLDFGFTKYVELLGERTKTFCGSPLFIPPEVHLDKPQDTKVDSFSLGALLFAMAFKRDLFDGATRKDITDNIVKHAESPCDISGQLTFDDYMHPVTKDEVELMDFVNLLDGLLQGEPERRISITDALNHRFFTDRSTSKKFMLLDLGSKV